MFLYQSAYCNHESHFYRTITLQDERSELAVLPELGQ